MKSCVLLLMTLFMLTNRTFGKDGNFKDVRKGKVVEPRYQFNHPPSVEYYNPIPVSIVYEDNNNLKTKSVITTVIEADESSKEVRKGKAAKLSHNLDHPPSAKIHEPIPVAIVFENYNNNDSSKKDSTTETVIEENISVAVTDNKTKETVQQHKQDASEAIVNKNNNFKVEEKHHQNLNIWQIPVAVVYETDNDSYQNHQKRKTETPEPPKLRASSSRKIEADSNTQNIQNVQPSLLESDKVQSGINTKVFNKRIGDRAPVVPILEMESYVFSHNGNFHYSYESGDGTKAFSEGKQKTINDEAGESVVGGFSYTDKDGNDYSLTYTADENGYRPVGAHLPTPPPIPPAIARALAYLATATPEPVTDKPGKTKP